MLSALNYFELPQLRNVNIPLSHIRNVTFEIRTLWRTGSDFNPPFPSKNCWPLVNMSLWWK